MTEKIHAEFRSARSKLARAREHMLAFSGALVEYYPQVLSQQKVEPLSQDDGNLYERGQIILRHRQAGSNDPVQRALELYRMVYAHRLYIDAPPFEEINAIAADAVQNLRQALDHSACACARLAGKPDEHTQFPLRGAPKSEEDRITSNKDFKNKIRHLPQSIREIVKLSEPGGGLLYELHALGLADKHRAICDFECHPAAEMLHLNAGPSWIAAGLGEDEWDPSAKCLNFALSGSPNELDYDFRFTVRIRFNTSGIIAAKPANVVLDEIANTIDRIIGEMELEMVRLTS
ncbi:hypothetical protein [Methylobacterium sp. CM6246]